MCTTYMYVQWNLSKTGTFKKFEIGFQDQLSLNAGQKGSILQ